MSAAEYVTFFHVPLHPDLLLLPHSLFSFTCKTQVTHRRFFNFERMYLENDKRERLVIINKYVSKQVLQYLKV